MFGAFIFTRRSENEAPNDPVISVFRLFLNAFSNFLDCFHDITFFKLSEGPMHMCVVTIAIEFFGLAADIKSFLVYHVHVEEESKIVICKRMCIIQKNAPLEMFHSLRVVANLEV